MSSNDLFTDAQHGFISGKSCVTQLLEYMEDLTEAVDSECDVDVIYLDLYKAFDKAFDEIICIWCQRYTISMDTRILKGQVPAGGRLWQCV